MTDYLEKLIAGELRRHGLREEDVADAVAGQLEELRQATSRGGPAGPASPVPREVWRTSSMKWMAAMVEVCGAVGLPATLDPERDKQAVLHAIQAMHYQLDVLRAELHHAAALGDAPPLPKQAAKKLIRVLTTIQFADRLEVAHLSSGAMTLCNVGLFGRETPGWSRGGGQCGGDLRISACPDCVDVAYAEFPGAKIVGGTPWSNPLCAALDELRLKAEGLTSPLLDEAAGGDIQRP